MADREKLIELLNEAGQRCGDIECYDGEECEYAGEINGCMAFIADHLLANGVVVREKGEWAYDHWCEFKCSKCGALSKTEPRGEENFCPNCGADMRKGENG